MPSSFLAMLNMAAKHSSKVAAVSLRGTAASAAVTADDLAVLSSTPAKEGIPQELEVKFLKETAWASIKNKAWLFPALLGTVAVFPAALHPLLTMGGAYLAYEGTHEAHELLEEHLHHHEAPHAEGHSLDDAVLVDEKGTPLERMMDTVKKASLLDVILSAEIGIIALTAMGAGADFASAATNFAQSGQLSAYLEPLALHGPAMGVMAVGITAGVFAPVAVLLRADNWAEKLQGLEGDGLLAKMGRGLGNMLVPASHKVMQALPYIGTAAMLAVGGHIMLENIPSVAHAVKDFAHTMGGFGFVAEYGAGIAAGLVSGLAIDKVVMPVVKPVAKLAKSGFSKIRALFGMDNKGLDANGPDIAPDIAPAVENAPMVSTEPAAKAKAPAPDMRAHLAEAVTPADTANQNIAPTASPPAAGLNRDIA